MLFLQNIWDMFKNACEETTRKNKHQVICYSSDQVVDTILRIIEEM